MNYATTAAYQKAFALAMEIFDISRTFPKEELYSLTDQLRRSSRSVCANIAEAWRRKPYPKYYIAKLVDCDAENAETQVWLEFALRCNYMSESSYAVLYSKTIEIGKLLHYMMQNPGRF